MSTKNDKYSINKNLINDYICRHNNRKKPYIGYCSSCKKNFCLWCKEHKSHNIIKFENIEPSQEKYEKFESQMNNMKDIGEKIKKCYLEIKNFQEFINEINNIINNELKQLKQFEEEFISHLNYNDAIFHSYQEFKKNYYIISNFNSLDFDSENDYLNNNENLKKIYDIMNKINGNNEISFNISTNLSKENGKSNANINNFIYRINKSDFFERNPKNENFSEIRDSKLKNMWISEKYCKSWGLREAIREFIQNQYDGIITKIESKKNLKVEKTGKEYIINGRKKYLDYNFINIKDKKKYGEIRYNNEKNILQISNDGEIFLADFLLGGSKDEQNNTDIIGIFGEGMKIAILALCRLGKNVKIFSSGKKYTFLLKEDRNFVKDSKIQKCLHCRIEDCYEKNLEGKVFVIINNIKEEEWGEQIDKFLWLLGNDIEIYTSVDNNNNVIGQIIFEDYLKGKIYVKGIYVQDVEIRTKKDNEDEESIRKNIPGLNTNLKLDRDRNSIPNNYELETMTTKIISGTYNKNIDYLKEVQEHKGGVFIRTEFGFEKSDGEGGGTIDSGLKNLTKNLIEILQKEVDVINYYTLKSNLSQESIEIIWNEMNLKPENKNKYPSCTCEDIIKFLDDKKLPKEFYPYYKVSFNLMKVLEKSKNFIELKKKFEDYAENAESIEPNDTCQKALDEIFSKIQNILPEFNKNNVHFKQFSTTDKNFCFKSEKNIFFSSAKLEEELTNEWKFWIFIKILNVSNIKIEDNYKKINNCF